MESTDRSKLLTRLQLILTIITILVMIAGFYLLVNPILDKFLIEIKERKSAEITLQDTLDKLLKSDELLRANQKDLRSISDAIDRSALVSITDKDGKIIKVNKLFCDTVGYQENELVGFTHKVINSGYHSRSFWKKFWNTISSGNSWKGEVKNKTKEGKEVWFNMVVSPILNPDGTMREYLAIRMDITKRKIAEDRFNQLNQALQAISNASLPVSIIGTDLNGTITLFSRGAEALLGYKASELIGKQTPAILHLPDEIEKRGAELSASLNRKVEGFEVFIAIPTLMGYESREWTYVRKDQTALPVQLVVSTISGGDGRINGYFGIAVDLTERKAAEQSMIDAKEQAEAANRSKSQFLANMSHEIRTPLNSILGFSEILQDLMQDEKQKKYFRNIIANGRTLLALINDLLNMAKIDAGKLKLDYEKFNLHQLLTEVYEMFLQAINGESVALKLEIQPNLPVAIKGDQIRLKQILVNLVGNAVKFTSSGFVRIIVNYQIQESDSRKMNLTIRVQDTGIGIAPKDQVLIFESFHQVHDTTTSAYGGTGLGLSITKRLVDLMHGSISVESQLGTGSIFTVQLPDIEIFPADAEQPVIIDSLPPELPASENPKAKIMIVDDVPGNIELVEGFLEQYPVQCIAARSGHEALSLLDKIKPDLILMDLKMPVLDGFETTKLIRQKDAFKTLPIVACTANVLGMSEVGAPFDGLIIKPFRKSVLISELEKHLKSFFPQLLLQGAQQIDQQAHYRILLSTFGNALLKMTRAIDVAAAEQLIPTLKIYIQENHITALDPILKRLESDFADFNLDAFSKDCSDLLRILSGENL
jgi:PAS domain S-box-containing protein